MRIGFEDRVVVVTGAGRGLGRSYALDFARRGAKVIVNDLGGVGKPEGSWADGVVKEIEAAGGTAAANYDSVATEAGGQAIIAAALDRFGRIDAVVNNAGFLRPGYFAEVSTKNTADIMDVHLMSAFFVTQPAWREMLKQGYGRVVFTSSSAAFGNEANSNYSAAKTGLIGLARSLAREGAARDCAANCIIPSAQSLINVDNAIPTEESVRYRAGLSKVADRRTADSVAPLVTYLASEACKANGETYSSVAGRYARVAFTVADGWLSERPDSVTAEQIAEHFGEIEDLSQATHPTCISEELERVIEQLEAKGIVPAA